MAFLARRASPGVLRHRYASAAGLDRGANRAAYADGPSWSRNTARGSNLLELLSGDVVPQGDVAQAIVDLFKSLHDVRISHGDLKATNLLWHAGRLLLIDLDAVQQHASSQRHAKAWQRDRARLLRNWPSTSPCCISGSTPTCRLPA
jgi:hypothetical protein